MSNSARFNLVLPSSALATTDDGWQDVQPEYIKVWASAVHSLREHPITVGPDRYTALVDWTSTLQRHKRYYSALQYVHSGAADKGAYIQRLLKANFPKRPAQNPIEVHARGVRNPQLLSIAENVVYDSFFMMNIAAPSSCNFYRAMLLGDKIEPNVSLSHHAFELLHLVSLKEKWPSIAFLNLDRVIVWYRAVRQGALQIPSNPMERVLFSLFHISKIDMSPVEVVWLFYAFESLLQTSVGQNFALIVKRLCLLLEADDKQSSLVRKLMRDLYDLRSAIVHGGYQITHPMHDAGLDKRVMDSFVRETRATDYGYALLISAVQKAIVKGWKYPRFAEVIEGEQITVTNDALQ